MSSIADEHVEWAIVHRLKAMLDEPPQTIFNVTQTFALFSSVLLWTKNRAWVAGNCRERREWQDDADRRAHDFREAMRDKQITEDPWRLSLIVPQFVLIDRAEMREIPEQRINADFKDMSAEEFFKWLRDALAHGDGRTIKPIHKSCERTGKTLLAGFRVKFPAERRVRRTLKLHLYHEDMRRIGIVLADNFCKALDGRDRYSEQEVWIEEVAQSA